MQLTGRLGAVQPDPHVHAGWPVPVVAVAGRVWPLPSLNCVPVPEIAQPAPEPRVSLTVKLTVWVMVLSVPSRIIVGKATIWVAPLALKVAITPAGVPD